MFKLFFVSLLFSKFASAATSYGVGQKNFTFLDAKRARTLSANVWYPVGANVKLSAVLQEGNPFVPVVAAQNAPIAKSKPFPIVLLSHGSGGKADKLFWLTEKLVRAGIVVIAVNHPGNRTGDNSGDGMMRVWDRAPDLSFALDQVIERPFFKKRLDLKRIAAAGHSAGGTTVLLLAGARLSSTKLQSPIPTCDGTKDPYLAKLCEELKTIDMKAYPKALVEADYSDARVKAVVSLDPGFARSFEAESLKQLKAKPLLFLAEKMNTSHDQILAKEFVNLLEPKEVEIVPNSYHMTFLQACEPSYPKDDPELAELCVENDSKLQIQKKVADASLQFFLKSWGKTSQSTL